MGSLTTEGKDLQHRFAHDPRVKGLISEDSVGNMCRCMGFATEHGKVEYAYESIKKLREAGIDVLWYVHPIRIMVKLLKTIAVAVTLLGLLSARHSASPCTTSCTSSCTRLE